MDRPVIKLEITKQDIMVKPDLTYLELFKPGSVDEFLHSKYGQVDDSKPVETLFYPITEVVTPVGSKFYAIQDSELLSHLFCVGKFRWETMQEQQRKIGHNTGFAQGITQGFVKGKKEGNDETVKTIKSLPWYKRLFKQF